jgi:hypothetical protein
MPIFDAVDINQPLRSRHSKIHHGDKTLAAGKNACVLALIGQQCERRRKGIGPCVVKWGRFHAFLPNIAPGCSPGRAILSSPFCGFTRQNGLLEAL